MQREKMEFDIIIVGGGPAGLTAAIHLKQLAQRLDQDLKICVIEKGAQIGAHILSGAVLEPRTLNELIPDWQKHANFHHTPVIKDEFLFLTRKFSVRLPTPGSMKNHGNYIVSLGEFCQFLAQYAEKLGVEIYPGFTASDLIIENYCVKGIITGDMGIGKDGQPTSQFQPGMELRAKQTLIAEGCRGSLTQKLFQLFNLREKNAPQTYAIGIKELWEVDSPLYQKGLVTHTVGWPLDRKTYGGSFLYHMHDNLISIGFVIGLDYQNPYLNPFEEMQRFKTHPKIKSLFQKGKRISYGARALNEGGFQAIPKLAFPGGLIIGDAAGFLNVAKIKGTHTAMKSAMLAAETIFEALLQQQNFSEPLIQFSDNIKQSWIWDELYRVRNIRPAFKWGLWFGLSYSAIDYYLLRGHAPWTFQHHFDHEQLKPAKFCHKIVYEKPDGLLTFDKMSSVFLTNTFHEENQPCHLMLKQPDLALEHNFKIYDAPEQRYCPAGVYEIVIENNQPRLQINAQNCIHCKTCDIKDPKQNIVWQPPQGGEGPNYVNM